MALHGADARGDTPHAEVRETGFDAVRPLMEAWYRESMGEAEARDLADSDADSAARTGAPLLPQPSATASLPRPASSSASTGSARSSPSTPPRPTAATGWPAWSSARRSPRPASAATTS